MAADITPVAELTGSQLLYAHGLLAIFGALVHASNAHRKGASKTLLDFLILTLMASFTGILFALVAFSVFDNPYLTLAFTATGGYWGVEGIAWLIEVLKTALSTKLNQPEK